MIFMVCWFINRARSLILNFETVTVRTNQIYNQVTNSVHYYYEYEWNEYETGDVLNCAQKHVRHTKFSVS